MKNSKANRLFVTALSIVILIIVVILPQLTKISLPFTYLEPSYIPAGNSLKVKEITTLKLTDSTTTWATLSFRHEDNVYSIRESSKDTGYGIGDAPQNLDHTSVKPTCNHELTPSDIAFRVCHWIDYNRISVYEVKFIKAGTSVTARLPVERDEKVEVRDIARFVDSFREVDHLKVKHRVTNTPT